MARVLGYGGLANTHGARTFSGREQAAATGQVPRSSRYRTAYQLSDRIRALLVYFGV